DQADGARQHDRRGGQQDLIGHGDDGVGEGGNALDRERQFVEDRAADKQDKANPAGRRGGQEVFTPEIPEEKDGQDQQEDKVEIGDHDVPEAEGQLADLRDRGAELERELDQQGGSGN